MTTGKPQVTDVISLKGTASQILDLAVSLSRQSHHPLSQAVVAHTNNQNYLDLVDFQEISGHGLVAKLMVNAGKKQKVMIGNKKLLEAKDIDIDDATLAQVSELQSAGKTVNYVVQ
ncbi:MAG: cation-translocating P-type ATPase [Candidatus Peribacteria bacterium]|nr:MAG: cation-translocating P-type ATPase [Candidatus Peribacteria bacterium]